MNGPPLRTIALGGTLAAAFALAIAHGSEIWAELVPCALCLWERWPYRIAAVCGIAAALAPRRYVAALVWLAILWLLGGAALGLVHVGVEMGWWPSPLPECAAPRFSSGSIADRLAAMPVRPSKPCDEPVFLIPGLPLSMASMSFLYAATVAAMMAVLTVWRPMRR
jgi:disulfide bond formation protein DsbB